MSDFNSSITNMITQLEGFISTKTVVGEAIVCGKTTVIPLIDVSIGLGGGASAGDESKKKAAVNGGGLGAKIKPSALLVVDESGVQLVNINQKDSINKLIDMIPGIAQKLGLDKLFQKKEKPAEPETTEVNE
ncbi:MAG: GerW family sporulation protein [Defluviitaleaceae bacterium]|nr:GerW family sporulation protein [Defluviitaleaceae bacterium]